MGLSTRGLVLCHNGAMPHTTQRDVPVPSPASATRMTVRIDDDLYVKLREKAYQEHRPLTDIIRSALIAHLADPPLDS